MENQTESEGVESATTLTLVVIPVAVIVTMVSMTLVGMIPHSVASPAVLSRVNYSMLVLACIAFACAVGAERARGVTATVTAAISSGSLSAWFGLTMVGAFFSWNGHDWADNSQFWLRFSSLVVAFLAFFILSDFGGYPRVRRH